MTDPGPQQQPTPPPTPSGAGAPADLVTRFLARLIDYILTGIAISIITIPFSVTAFGFGFSGAFFLSGIIQAVVWIGYFAFMESQMGQTVGKMLMGIRTEGPSGNKPTLEEALKRNAWHAVAIIPILGVFGLLAAFAYIAYTINLSPTRIGWHDTFAGGTKVVKTK